LDIVARRARRADTLVGHKPEAIWLTQRAGNERSNPLMNPI